DCYHARLGGEVTSMRAPRAEALPTAGSHAAQPGSVRAYLLGTFRVEVPGRALGDQGWRRRKARQVLKYLLTQPNHRAQKEELVELFWPEQPAGGISLRSALTALRQALEPADLVVSDQDGVCLRADADIWTDVAAFQALVDQAHVSAEPIPLLEQAD